MPCTPEEEQLRKEHFERYLCKTEYNARIEGPEPKLGDAVWVSFRKRLVERINNHLLGGMKGPNRIIGHPELTWEDGCLELELSPLRNNYMRLCIQSKNREGFLTILEFRRRLFNALAEEYDLYIPKGDNEFDLYSPQP